MLFFIKFRLKIKLIGENFIYTERLNFCRKWKTSIQTKCDRSLFGILSLSHFLKKIFPPDVISYMLTVHFILLKKTHIIMKYLCFIIIILLVQQGFSKGISILDQIRGLEQKVKKLENENVELKKQNNADNNDLDILKSKIVS